MGNWDGTKAVPLEWSEGDNWTAKVSLPAGASAEYKYIIKRKDGLDWCPGQNKAVALPAAVAVEVSDSWEHSTNTMAVTGAGDSTSPLRRCPGHARMLWWRWTKRGRRGPQVRVILAVGIGGGDAASEVATWCQPRCDLNTKEL
ncbi:hypothetical protein CHLRE_06g269601v5 [Chlamydomonas reinhardtii]|uniref:CBM20 domain-containing protein n=1 Tax=Chlamydomonas reinhardtii TaxID=3055 RepID=A0A2K3DNA6_CHLRE|nr:uncharacterized protein CHLRE_06g269601v5 [Chlamydomonas reinhardtii]PNW82000.1 hypothetical protein CHLRE_06g269601v5 [Chlamydomonas reinhardtii]